jgi:ABC-type transport system involved in multi-copper enzyme maturation permease subunit
MLKGDESRSLIPEPSRLGAWLRRNPVTLKELRGRMRGARAFIVLTVYITLMSIFTVGLYAIYTASATFSLASSGGVIGKLIFGGVVAIELFLVCFVAPAFTAGAISGERERQTYHLLRVTLLPEHQLVTGKLVAALAYIVLLLFVAVPLQSLAFLMGGVVIEEVLLSLWLLLVTAVGYGTVGIFASVATRRTLNASVLTYTFALFTTVALPLGTLGLTIFIPLGVSAINNPILEALFIYVFGLLASTNPLSAAVVSEVILLQQSAVFYFTIPLSNGFPLPAISPWIVYTLVVAVVSVVILRRSVQIIRRVDT